MAGKFKVGELIVYPTKGVGKIVGTEKLGGEDFYIIELLEKDIQIKVPVDRAGSMGVRRPVSREKIKKVLSMLRNYRMSKVRNNWNKRQKIYKEKLRTGKIEDTAEVFAELYYSSQRKHLSFGEKKLMEQVRTMLLQEIAISSGASLENIEEEFEKIIS